MLMLVGALAFVLGFAFAFAVWRWGLGSMNWLEGAIVAAVSGGVAAAVVVTLAGTRQDHVVRHLRDVKLSTSGGTR